MRPNRSVAPHGSRPNGDDRRTGLDVDAQLEEDEWHMLWLNTPNLVTGKRQGRYLLSAVLKIGWRIVAASPDEQAMLEAPGRRGKASSRPAPTHDG